MITRRWVTTGELNRRGGCWVPSPFSPLFYTARRKTTNSCESHQWVSASVRVATVSRWQVDACHLKLRGCTIWPVDVIDSCHRVVGPCVHSDNLVSVNLDDNAQVVMLMSTWVFVGCLKMPEPSDTLSEIRRLNHCLLCLLGRLPEPFDKSHHH